MVFPMQKPKDIKIPRHVTERLRRQPQPAVQGTTLRSVRQDNPPRPTARPASPAIAPQNSPARYDKTPKISSVTKRERAQKKGRQTYLMGTSWSKGRI